MNKPLHPTTNPEILVKFGQLASDTQVLESRPMLFRGSFLVLYADDILLISPSVCMLEKLLRMCEHELELLDMAINTRKSCCLCTGPRHISCCGSISTSAGANIHG